MYTRYDKETFTIKTDPLFPQGWENYSEEKKNVLIERYKEVGDEAIEAIFLLEDLELFNVCGNLEDIMSLPSHLFDVKRIREKIYKEKSK